MASSKHPTLIVAVGSRSPAKLSAVARVFGHYPELWMGRGGLTVLPHDGEAMRTRVHSTASHNPRDTQEMIRGAQERAGSAHEAALEWAEEGDVFGVGLEAGIREVDFDGRTVWFTGTVAVIESRGKRSLGHSPSFPVPERAVARILDGEELGAMPDLFGNEGKARGGVVEKLTAGRVSRDDLDSLALHMALCPWVSSDLYEGSSGSP